MPNPLHDPRYASFRALLAAERERVGLTQVEVAGRLRKPQSYVSKYERGERRLDVVEYLDIARVLGIDPLATIKKLIDKIA
ncbi:MAG: helix-turn-helix transcriptional regulator [Rhodocyclaceae bacterium]|nr:helix-turn-helix transcriptional regulator [Rhodocyclaceae bacterium]